MKYDIPLSYNPIDYKRLAALLEQYEHRHHQDLITDFESALKTITGTKEVVALQSCTAAIHLALKALGVQPGDHVIASSFTYIGAVVPILHAGAIPVLVDSEPISWNMDTALLQQAIEDLIEEKKKPKVILVVHNYGMPANMDTILAIAGKYEIAVLEDAAEAIGSIYNGKAAGSLADMGVLSFNNNKTVTGYGGGAIITQSKEAADKIRFWATQAREHEMYYLHKEVGFNYMISPLNAAAALINLGEYGERVIERCRLFDFYYKELQRVGCSFQCVIDSRIKTNRWLTAVAGIRSVENLLCQFINERIEVRPLWKPMHDQPLFGKFRSYINGVSDGLFKHGLCLPSGNNVSKEDLERIVHLLKTHV